MQPEHTTPNDHDSHPAPASDEASQSSESVAGESDDPQQIIAALRSELEQAQADALRERADLDNQRKRLARDVDMARKFANERLLSDLLPLFDSMEAGLAAGAGNDPLREGIVLTLRQLHKIAEANGLIEVAPARGDAFDPERHQAMGMIDAEEIAPGAVAQTFQKGYVLNERLLRPALVMVAKQD
jgi:molecular chaperone GrpE